MLEGEPLRIDVREDAQHTGGAARAELTKPVVEERGPCRQQLVLAERLHAHASNPRQVVPRVHDPPGAAGPAQVRAERPAPTRQTRPHADLTQGKPLGPLGERGEDPTEAALADGGLAYPGGSTWGRRWGGRRGGGRPGRAEGLEDLGRPSGHRDQGDARPLRELLRGAEGNLEPLDLGVLEDGELHSLLL